MWAIAKAEGGDEYPYVIRINGKAKVKIPWLRQLRKNVYDCRNYETCVYVARELIKRGIKNFDMGPFQINYLYHRFPPEKAFLVPESYEKACSIVLKKIKKFGWNWRGIAAYHSANPKENEKYAERLRRILFRIAR